MVIGKQKKPPLQASQYRELWLEDANTLGLIGECLAEALGWQPTGGQVLPDALELAGAAAERIALLERAVAVGAPWAQPQLKGRRERERELA